MRHVLSLSTGCVYTWGKMNEILDSIRREFCLSGIEIMLAKREMVEDFAISDANKKWLTGLEYVSLHAPVKFLQEVTNDEDACRLLTTIDEIYSAIGAKAVIFHVTSLPKLEWLRDRRFSMVIENTTTKGKVDIELFSETVAKYGCGICLDVSHAFTWSEFESEKYFDRFKEKILQIHLSASNGAHEHLPFSESSSVFRKSVSFLGAVAAPKVIECDYTTRDIDFIKKDLKLLSNFLER